MENVKKRHLTESSDKWIGLARFGSVNETSSSFGEMITYHDSFSCRVVPYFGDFFNSKHLDWKGAAVVAINVWQMLFNVLYKLIIFLIEPIDFQFNYTVELSFNEILWFFFLQSCQKEKKKQEIFLCTTGDWLLSVKIFKSQGALVLETYFLKMTPFHFHFYNKHSIPLFPGSTFSPRH